MSELALSSLKRDIARVGANENTGWRAQIHDGIVVKVETFLETFQSVAAYLEEEVDGPELIKTTYAQCEEIAADCAELDNKYVDVIGGLTSLKHHMQTWQAKDKQERKEGKPQYKELLDKFINEAATNRLSSQRDPKKHKYYKQLMPMIPGLGDNDDDDINEVVVGGMSGRALVCPLTQDRLVQPVRNGACGHIYSKQAILNHLAMAAKNKRQCRCPVAGCDKFVSKKDLKADKRAEHALKRADNEMESRRQASETESDDEETL